MRGEYCYSYIRRSNLTTHALGRQFTGQYISLLNNTGMILFILPLLILYALMQRYFIESIERTGLVG